MCRVCLQDFMNGVCTDILHMHKKNVTLYKGNFDTYVTSRAQAEELQMKKYAFEQEQVRPPPQVWPLHCRHFIASVFSSWASSFGRPVSAQLHRLFSTGVLGLQSLTVC
jgi:hypothetical protein